MSLSLAAAFLATFANATQETLPLPGYSPPATLTAIGENLRDAVISPSSTALLLDGLRSHKFAERLAAIDAAGLPGHVAAVPYLSGALLRLDEDPQLRVAAAISLGRIGSALASASLATALGDPVAEVRFSAALALGRIPPQNAAQPLAHALRTDSSWLVRHAAAIALSRSSSPFVFTALEESLRLDPQWQVRLEASRSLQIIGGAQASMALTAALKDPDVNVSSAAAQALAKMRAAPPRPRVKP